MKRIVVDPPTSDARRERVERQLFAQLAAVRVADRADAVIPPTKKSRAGFALGFAGLAAAAIALFMLVARDGEQGGTVTPSRVVTPAGGASQFTIGDAVIDARSDTSVEWRRESDGAITLVLQRGAIDCDVPPRADRPPFRVIAGDVTVVVVGTRFTVTRTPSPRVEVARGTVRVEASGGSWLVEAGELWTPATQTALAPPPAPASEPEPVAEPDEPATEPEIEMDPVKIPRAKKAAPAETKPAADGAVEPPATRELAKEAYRVALRLEASEPERAIAMYRAIAISNKAGGFAASALISLVELQIKLGRYPDALATIDEHQRRFPQGPTREEAAWYRIEALRAMGKRDAARGAAADYLREFPKGVYADRLSHDVR